MTMTNAEWMIKQGYKFSDIYAYGEYDNDGNFIWHIRISKAEIEEISAEQGCANAITSWLDSEHKETILDDAEKRYLKGVIMPFRNEIKAIAKDNYLANKLERIYFFTKEGEIFYLKYFKANTMYKGMEQKRQYTLEELGL